MSKELSLEEFRNLGFLQEINRLILHPAGLALSIEANTNEDGSLKDLSFGPILDFRDESDGCLFGNLDTEEAKQKAQSVVELQKAKEEYRNNKYGWHIQPVGTKLGDS